MNWMNFLVPHIIGNMSYNSSELSECSLRIAWSYAFLKFKLNSKIYYNRFTTLRTNYSTLISTLPGCEWFILFKEAHVGILKTITSVSVNSIKLRIKYYNKTYWPYLKLNSKMLYTRFTLYVQIIAHLLLEYQVTYDSFYLKRFERYFKDIFKSSISSSVNRNKLKIKHIHKI